MNVNRRPATDGVSPHNPEMERAILGLALNGHTPCILELVRDEQLFYDPRHRVIHDAIAALVRSSTALDTVTVTHYLEESGDLSAAGGVLYLATLASRDADVPATFRRHLQTLRHQHLQRSCHRIAGEFASTILTSADPITTVTDFVASLLNCQMDDQSEQGLARYAQQVHQLHQDARHLASTGREYSGLDCGFAPINRILNGLCPGEMTVIAGRTAMGKTTLALQMAYAAARAEQPVGIITLEMTGAQLYRRLAHIHSQVDPDLERRGQLQPSDADHFTRSVDALASWRLHIFPHDRTVPQIRARVERMPEVKLWIVDHLHRIAGYDRLREHEKLNRYAQELANVSVDKNVPILLLAQLNRDCEDRPDKTPHLSDLRASGGIEEHAVNVLLLFRPSYYSELTSKYAAAVKKQSWSDSQHQQEMGSFYSLAQAIIEKTRFGPTGVVDLSWNTNLALFA